MRGPRRGARRGRASDRLRLEDAVPWAAIQAGDAAVLAAGVLPADRAVDAPAGRRTCRAESGRRAGPRPARCRCPSSTPPGLRRAGARVPRVRRLGASSASARYRPRAAPAFASSMQIVRGLDQYRPDAPPSVVAQGTFDGIHLGHQAVIRTAVERAQALGVRPVAVTFEPNPLAVLRPADAPPELLTLDERLERIAELGPEVCLVIPFTTEFSLVEAEDYVRDVLLGLLRARERSSSASITRSGEGPAGPRSCSGAWPSAAGVVVHVVPPAARRRRRRLVHLDPRGPAGRGRSARGEPPGAALRRSRAWWPGARARGRALGFPTANLAASPGLLLADGVYTARADVGRGVRVGGRQRRGAAHRGRRDASGGGAPLRRGPGSLRTAPDARVPRPDPPGAAVRVAGSAPRADRRGRGGRPAVCSDRPS